MKTVVFESPCVYIEGLGCSRETVDIDELTAEKLGINEETVTVRVGDDFLARYLTPVSEEKDPASGIVVCRYGINHKKLLSDWIKAGTPREWKNGG